MLISQRRLPFKGFKISIMPIFDKFLSFIIKYLQKKQKILRKKEKAKKKILRKKRQAEVKLAKKKKKARKPIKPRLPKRRKVSRKRKTAQKTTKRKKSQRPKTKRLAPKLKQRKPARTKNLKAKQRPKKATPELQKVQSQSEGDLLGEVTHYFSQIEVIVLKIKKGHIRVGDQIHIKGRKTDFIQIVGSLQIESVNVSIGKKGQLVGLKVDQKVRQGDQVYKL